MTERERTTMVPFPSDAIIPERDLGTRPVLDARHLGVEFGEYSLRQYRYAKDYYRIVQDELKKSGKSGAQENA